MKHFKMVILPPMFELDWPERIRAAVPNTTVELFESQSAAMRNMEDADCAFGEVGPELFARARRIRWIQCHAAGPAPSFFHQALVKSDVVVTNFRGIYNDHVAQHAMSLVLALARRLNVYSIQQTRRVWRPLEQPIHLPDCTALVVGLGGIGTETARLYASFGMKVVAVEPQKKRRPSFVSKILPPEDLDELLPQADFVIITTPDTPKTRGMMSKNRFDKMKPAGYLINVGRGACVVLDDLVEAIHSKTISGAGLDVFSTEPLPTAHPLWTTPNVIITPHVAAQIGSPHISERRTLLLIENCKRFSRGKRLLNVVDKNEGLLGNPKTRVAVHRTQPRSM